ncbi:MAG: hypothetical protein LBT00_02990 [Spirochaetaceae bacterium]|jgi:hypothetical protein|nr:hypothetical protein [Spirochaetaceae bacterium]
MKRFISVIILAVVMVGALTSCYKPPEPEPNPEGSPEWLPRKGEAWTDEQLALSIMYVQSEIYHAADDDPMSAYAEAFKYGNGYYRAAVFAATYNNIINELTGMFNVSCMVIEFDSLRRVIPKLSAEEIGALYDEDKRTPKRYYVKVYDHNVDYTMGPLSIKDNSNVIAYVPLSYDASVEDFGKGPAELFENYDPVDDLDITMDVLTLDDNDQFRWPIGGLYIASARKKMYNELGLEFDNEAFMEVWFGGN